MRREHRLLIWAGALYLLASCFIESAAYPIVFILMAAGSGFWIWSAVIERRNQ